MDLIAKIASTDREESARGRRAFALLAISKKWDEKASGRAHGFRYTMWSLGVHKQLGQLMERSGIRHAMYPSSMLQADIQARVYAAQQRQQAAESEAMRAASQLSIMPPPSAPAQRGTRRRARAPRRNPAASDRDDAEATESPQQ